MQSRILVGLAALAAITLGLWWSRAERPAAAPLAVRRITPTEAVLRGSPNLQVQVELELRNTTHRAIELAPLKMSCNCQIAKAPDKTIAAGGTIRVLLSLRYPPAQQTLIPLEFKTPAGELLSRTEIALEADRNPPYFINCPELVEISMIDGVSDGTWSTSATTVELTERTPHVIGAHITAGADLMCVSLTRSENATPGLSECQRTYQLTFEMLDSALKSSPDQTSLRGTAVLDLLDGAEQPINFVITRKPPLALVFDSASGAIRGLRRGGAHGPVMLHCIPDGSGTLSPDRFEAGQPIAAKLDSGTLKPQSVEALYQGTASLVRVTLPIP